MEYRLLGPLEAVSDIGVVHIGRRKPRALLAALLLRANRTVGPDALIDDLWGPDPPSNPTATLHSHVAALRRYLRPHGADGALVTSPAGYVFHIAPEALDVTRFDALAAEGDAAASGGDLGAADGAYSRALALFRGPPLADLRDAAFAEAAAVRLDQARLQVVRQRVDVRLSQGLHTELLAELHALVVAEPLNEGFACQLMLAEYRAGRQAEALEVFATLRRRLDEELGVRPGPEADRLQAAILHHDPSLLLATGRDQPAASQGHVTRSVIGAPRSLDRLIGRAREVDRAIERLESHRVVTLTGPGGVGKTRLALAVAEDCAARGDRPVVFVDLAATTEAGDALVVLGDALDVDRSAHQTALDAVTEHIGGSPMLVVLDNLEQIPTIDAAVAGLVQDCPALTVLATSRVSLRIPGEARHPVRPLAIPPEGAADQVVLTSDAVILFLERAGAANADVRALEGQPDDIARLCRLLDGLPLALELAAARAGALPPGTLADHIRAGLDLEGVTTPSRPDRHRTLHATLTWSHDLLGTAARRLLAHLGSFAGGASLDAVEAVWAAAREQEGASAIDALTGLVDAGLVRSDPIAGRPRYRLPEPVRGFALTRLRDSGRAETVRTAHAAHFTAEARRDKPAPGVTDTRRLAVLDADVDNLRAALRWWLDTCAVDRAAELATGLYRWWFATGRFAEGRQWLDLVLAAADAHEGEGLEPVLRAEVLMCEGFLAANQADFDHALTRYVDSDALWERCGVPAGQARCRYGQGSVALGLNRPEDARRHYEAALDLARQAGDDLLVLRLLHGLGAAAEAAGDHAAAHEVYVQALAAARSSGSDTEVAHAAVGLALTTMAAGDPRGAEALAVEALEAADATGSSTVIAGVQLLAGVVAIGRRDADTAAARFGDGLVRSVRAQRPAHVSEALEGLAAVMAIRGDDPGAARTFATAARVLDEVGLDPENGLQRQVFDSYQVEVRDRLSPTAFEQARSDGAVRGMADLDDDAVAALLAVATGQISPDAAHPSPGSSS